MVRTYQKKRKEVNEDDMQRAIKAVTENNMPLRQAAGVFGVTHTALFYRVKKIDNPERIYQSKYTNKQVFSVEQETRLEEYILKCSKISYGMTYLQIRKLAYDYAKRLQNKYPTNWDTSNLAGIDWLRGFMKRHPKLSLRKPENTSLARATSFNKKNVLEFQNNLERALQSYQFTADRILNLDETGITTVVQAPNVVAQKGIKQVGQAVSAERGQLITMCAIVTASGNVIPPVFIFPRARMHEALMIGAPTGSLGLANSPKSGWITSALFLKTLEHIQKFTRCTPVDPILILMDNHESHCTLDAVLYARANGIVLVTFPPHCTHRLQPLDVAVMGPFKTKLMVAQNDWLTCHPGKTITIHDLPALANVAFTASFTMKNILSGFSKPGIWPFNRNAFSDEDFDQAYVTDRNEPEPEVTVENLPSTSATPSSSRTLACVNPDTEVHVTAPGSPENCESHVTSPHLETLPVTPEIVRPYPKAGVRVNKQPNRKKKTSRILTETPEKNNIETETLARLAKKRKPLLNLAVKRKIIEDSSSSEDSSYSVHDESDDLSLDESIEELDELNKLKSLKVTDFILVRFLTKKTEKYFVGTIEEILDTHEFKVKFLRRKGTTWKFYFPQDEDISDVNRDDIIMKLPSPSSLGTERMKSFLTFQKNLQSYNVGFFFLIYRRGVDKYDFDVMFE